MESNTFTEKIKFWFTKHHLFSTVRNSIISRTTSSNYLHYINHPTIHKHSTHKSYKKGATEFEDSTVSLLPFHKIPLVFNGREWSFRDAMGRTWLSQVVWKFSEKVCFECWPIGGRGFSAHFPRIFPARTCCGKYIIFTHVCASVL